MEIKISDISSELLKNPDISKKFDKKYVDGVIKERLAVLDYKKTFPNSLNEQDDKDDEEDIELDPEEIPIPEEEPENIIISDEPELVPSGDDDEINVEPDSEITPEPEVELKPETIPISPEIEKKQAEYEIISKEQARELLSYKGKIFTAVFTKKTDGSLRAMNGMTGVRKYTSGGELPYSPKDKGLVPVYDLKIGNGPKGYRMLNLDGLKTLNINGKKYKIDPFLKEIKVNNPNPGKEELMQLIGKNSIELGRDAGFKLIVKAARKIGWKESGESVSDYINNHPNLIPTFYREIKSLIASLQEIKVNKPLTITQFPIELKSRAEYDIAINFLKNKGYKWKHSGEITDHNSISTFPVYLIRDTNDKEIMYTRQKDWQDKNYPQYKDILQENMKKTELREIVKSVLKENQPQIAPKRQAPERETITKPETDTPERKPKRRTLAPPTEAPDTKPKAEGVIKENEEDIANKIAQRFQKLSK